MLILGGQAYNTNCQWFQNWQLLWWWFLSTYADPSNSSLNHNMYKVMCNLMCLENLEYLVSNTNMTNVIMFCGTHRINQIMIAHSENECLLTHAIIDFIWNFIDIVYNSKINYIISLLFIDNYFQYWQRGTVSLIVTFCYLG